MLLGDVIAEFDDPTVAAETLVALDDLSLLAKIQAAAAKEELSAGEFAVRAVDRFVAQAADEDWVTLFGVLARAADPGRAFLHRVLAASMDGVDAIPHGRRQVRSSG